MKLILAVTACAIALAACTPNADTNATSAPPAPAQPDIVAAAPAPSGPAAPNTVDTMSSTPAPTSPATPSATPAPAPASKGD